MFAIDEMGCKKLIYFAFGIKKRTALFLKQKSLKQFEIMMQGFIYGYNNACDYSLTEFYENTKSGNIWGEFHSYFINKYNISSMECLEVTEFCGSEEKAFDLFFEEFERYLLEHGEEIPEVK